MTSAAESSAVELLKRYSTLSLHTAEIDLVRRYQPTDVTTNPSLILEAVRLPEYRPIVEDVVLESTSWMGQIEERVEKAVDLLSVKFGAEILKIIPGRVSTVLDPSLSYDTKKACKRALRIMQMYKAAGVDTSRVLLKIASTWEGFQTAQSLEKEEIHCNMTLLFSPVQAALAIESGVSAISLFVGTVTSYFKEKQRKQTGFEYPPDEDPGVQNFIKIYNFVKAKSPQQPRILAAALLNKNQVFSLSGSDILTISPQIMKELAETTMEESGLQRCLSPETAKEYVESKNIPLDIKTDEESFQAALDNDAMTSTLLTEGIKNFEKDNLELFKLLRSKMEK